MTTVKYKLPNGVEYSITVGGKSNEEILANAIPQIRHAVHEHMYLEGIIEVELNNRTYKYDICSEGFVLG